MIEGRTILCFASGYDAPPTSKHHVMHLLAERNTVLWVNYHASRTPSVNSSDMLYMARKLGQVFSGMAQPRKNLHVLTPLVLPLPGKKWAQRLNRRLLEFQIRAALRKVRRGPLQVWSFTPDVSYLLDSFHAEEVVYYCVDDHANFSGYDNEQVLREEADLCRRADLVVTTSSVLQEAKAPLNPDTMLVTHGVDYDHFSKAVTDGLPTPPDIADIPHPRLGFFGLIRDWVDLALLADLARMRPEWHIVMIGDADANVRLEDYRSIPNMHFLGRKPYADLPAYCRQFDVGLIPFKINDLTRAVNPIKLREYLAAGLPVVSTPMPEVESCGHPVEIADTPEACESAIAAALSSASEASSRSAAMATETWPAKVAAISRRLAASVAECPAARPRGAAARRGSARRKPRRRKVLVVSAGGGFDVQIANFVRHCPKELDLLIVGLEGATPQLQQALDGISFAFRPLRFSRKQRRARTVAGSFPDLLFGTISALEILWKERPDAIVGIGQRAASYFLLAARLFSARTVFVEDITRVTCASATARVVAALRLADRIYVQWPQMRRELPRSVYGGRLL